MVKTIFELAKCKASHLNCKKFSNLGREVFDELQITIFRTVTAKVCANDKLYYGHFMSARSFNVN